MGHPMSQIVERPLVGGAASSCRDRQKGGKKGGSDRQICSCWEADDTEARHHVSEAAASCLGVCKLFVKQRPHPLVDHDQRLAEYLTLTDT